MAIAPSILRGRILTTSYRYDDPDHPDRPTSTITSPAWTADDRSLLLGLEQYEATLCPGGCGQPRHVAWHAAAEGEYEAHAFLCHACSAKAGREVVYSAITRLPPEEKVARFKPFDVLTTTTEPTKAEGAPA